MRKIDRITSDDISRTVHAVILAGGPSDNPLARFRAMPAVELGMAQHLNMLFLVLHTIFHMP